MKQWFCKREMRSGLEASYYITRNNIFWDKELEIQVKTIKNGLLTRLYGSVTLLVLRNILVKN